jgi:hypothetical protein
MARDLAEFVLMSDSPDCSKINTLREPIIRMHHTVRQWFEIGPERRRSVVARQTRIDRLPNVALGVRALVVELLDCSVRPITRGNAQKTRTKRKCQ